VTFRAFEAAMPVSQPVQKAHLTLCDTSWRHVGLWFLLGQWLIRDQVTRWPDLPMVHINEE
jgi:hypothetical protein